VEISVKTLYILLLLLVILDCYTDDLLEVTGSPAETIFQPSTAQIWAFLLIWSVLIGLAMWLLLKIRRDTVASIWFRRLSLVLIVFALIVSITNQMIRFQLFLSPSISQKGDVPAVYFVQTYSTRMSVYLTIILVGLLLAWKMGRSSATRISKAGSLLMILSLVGASFIIFTGALGTLAASPYWHEGSIDRGSIFMGTVPRELSGLLEPWITLALLAGLLLVGWEILSGDKGVSMLLPLLLLFLVILVQALPRIYLGSLTEALYSTDFYYSFRLDRSISFPSLPIIMVFVASETLGLFLGKSKVDDSGAGNPFEHRDEMVDRQN